MFDNQTILNSLPRVRAQDAQEHPMDTRARRVHLPVWRGHPSPTAAASPGGFWSAWSSPTPPLPERRRAREKGGERSRSG
jgi:hypothetical protein